MVVEVTASAGLRSGYCMDSAVDLVDEVNKLV